MDGVCAGRHHNIATRTRWSKGYARFLSLAISSGYMSQGTTSNVRQSVFNTLLLVPLFPALLTRRSTLYLFAVVNNKCSDKRTISCELTREECGGGRWSLWMGVLTASNSASFRPSSSLSASRLLLTHRYLHLLNSSRVCLFFSSQRTARCHN